MPNLNLNLDDLCEMGGNIPKQIPIAPKQNATRNKVLSEIRVNPFLALNLSIHINT